MKKKWEYMNKTDEEIEYIINKFNVSRLVAKVIANRDFKTDEEILNFLNPDISRIYDPYLMMDMDIAVDRVIKAIDNKEKILNYINNIESNNKDIKSLTTYSVSLNDIKKDLDDNFKIICELKEENKELSNELDKKSILLNNSNERIKNANKITFVKELMEEAM